MTSLLALFSAVLLVLTLRLYDQLETQKRRADREAERVDHAQWRALVAEDTAHKLRAHLTSIAGRYAERGAENEALRLEIWKRPQPAGWRLQPVRIPSDEELEAGQWS